MSFETEAELDLTLSERSLREVKQRISGELGTTEVGVTDGGTMSAQAAQGGGRGRRRARRSYRMAETRTDLLEESVTYLEEIEDHLAEGVGGGGGVVDDMLGAVVETGGDAAIEGGGMLADLGIETLGTTVGTAVSDAIAGSSISVSEPSWSPLEVEQPEPIDVEEAPTAGFEEPPGPVGFKDLPGPVGFEELPGPVSVEDPSPLAVESVEPLPVEEVGPIEVAVDVSASGSGGGQSSSSGRLTRGGESGGDGTLSMLDMVTEGTKTGGPFGSLAGVSGYAAKVLDSDTDAGPIVDGDEQGLIGSSKPSSEQPFPTGSAATSQPSGGQGGREVSVTVNLDSRNDVVVEPDSADIADDVIDEVEKYLQDALDDLRGDLRDAEDDIARLEGALGGAR